MKQLSAAIITAYRPDDRLPSRLAPIATYCDFVIIVDNTPGGHAFAGLPENSVVIQDGINHGLGNALNRGIQKARELKAETVFLFDQDSTPSQSDLHGLREGLARFGGQRVLVGPTHLDDQSGMAGRRSTGAATAPMPVRCLPTSGLAFEPALLGADDVFSEALFLDLVDFEWCCRLVQKGWKLYRLPDVLMLHRLGLGEGRFWGISYSIPAPFRHYFKFRDTIKLIQLPYVPLRVKLGLSYVLPFNLLFFPFILDNGWVRLKWMLAGIRDALGSVSGIGAAAKHLQ